MSSNPPLLLLRLEGPLQSWGLRARWDVRDSGDEPSKSGVIGLLGCAFGFTRGDPRLAELDRETHLGIRAEREGTPMVDFQTITGLLPRADGKVKGSLDEPATIVSPRAYLQDAAFLVILGGARDLLERSAAALQAPRWPVYLGRKSCLPSRPVFDRISFDFGSVREALAGAPWDWLGRRDEDAPFGRLRCVLEDPEGEAVRADALLEQPARMYGNRRVTTFWVDAPTGKEF